MWCHQKESNPRPTAYKAVALPTELWWHATGACRWRPELIPARGGFTDTFRISSDRRIKRTVFAGPSASTPTNSVRCSGAFFIASRSLCYTAPDGADLRFRTRQQRAFAIAEADPAPLESISPLYLSVQVEGPPARWPSDIFRADGHRLLGLRRMKRRNSPCFRAWVSDARYLAIA